MIQIIEFLVTQSGDKNSDIHSLLQINLEKSTIQQESHAACSTCSLVQLQVIHSHATGPAIHALTFTHVDLENTWNSVEILLSESVCQLKLISDTTSPETIGDFCPSCNQMHLFAWNDKLHHQLSLLESVSTIPSHSSLADNWWHAMINWKWYRTFVCILTIYLNCSGNCQDSELPVWQVYVIQCRSCFEEWMVYRCCIFLLTFRKSRLFKCFCSTLRSWHL